MVIVADFVAGTPEHWRLQLADALDAALGEYRAIEAAIRRGEGGLMLVREQTERRIRGLTAQLAESRA